MIDVRAFKRMLDRVRARLRAWLSPEIAATETRIRALADRADRAAKRIEDATPKTTVIPQTLILLPSGLNQGQVDAFRTQWEDAARDGRPFASSGLDGIRIYHRTSKPTPLGGLYQSWEKIVGD